MSTWLTIQPAYWKPLNPTAMARMPTARYGVSQLIKPVGPEKIHEALSNHYESEPCIRVMPLGAEDSLDQGFLDPQAANGTNRIDLFVFGHSDQMLLIARLDNLGKGASGAAVQNMNLMLQVSELEGLNV